MKFGFFLAAMFLLCPISGFAETSEPSHTLPSDTPRQHLLSDEFKVSQTLEAIPTSVKEEFAQLAGQRAFEMVAPGQRYQETDVLEGGHLPNRRLLFSGLSSSYCLIIYEKGGYAHEYRVALFNISSDHSRFESAFSLGVKPNTIADAQNAIRQNDYSVVPNSEL